MATDGRRWTAASRPERATAVRCGRWSAVSASWPTAPLGTPRLTLWLPHRAPAGLRGRTTSQARQPRTEGPCERALDQVLAHAARRARQAARHVSLFGGHAVGSSRRTRRSACRRSTLGWASRTVPVCSIMCLVARAAVSLWMVLTLTSGRCCRTRSWRCLPSSGRRPGKLRFPADRGRRRLPALSHAGARDR